MITDFCKFAETVLNEVKDDVDLLEVIKALDTSENFDSLTGTNLVNHLIKRLSSDGVKKWMQIANNDWFLRHICSAFREWSDNTKVETIRTLLEHPRSEKLQYAIGNCIDSLFKIKVRAGEWVKVSLIEGGEEVLRQLVTTTCGKHVVKNVIKNLSRNTYYKSTLPVLWMCLSLWSKISLSDQMSKEYSRGAEELLVIAKGGEESMKVLLDLLLALLSQPLRYHRKVTYYVFVQLLECVNDEHTAHIIETLMMSDGELVDENDSDENSSEIRTNTNEQSDEEPYSESSSNDEGMDLETLGPFERASGNVAVKRRNNEYDEEENDASVSDAEMFQLDERLSAAFKSIAPVKKKKRIAPLASAFRLRLVDLLLFTISSPETPSSVKIHMIIPLLKLAKLQLKHEAESPICKKTISLLNILSRLKKIYLVDEEVLNLLDQLVHETIGVSNPILVSTAAALSSFIVHFKKQNIFFDIITIFSLGITPDGVCSESVLSAFVGLFERFMNQEDGLIGCDLAIAAIIRHPYAFVSKSNIFVKASFNDDFRVFRKTEALLCLSTILNKNVLRKVSVEKAVVKCIAKLSSEYISASVSQPNMVCDSRTTIC
ncbi:hypothetical protein DICVIV_06985 [Dictyocaulus viviparus]|uniref:Uncharacterized protein n=1 Tax=Dictyocaulus viviparus TaxID=29172 RepID=A0A0D8XQN2_DICVI|nr:hypothetical protein DICVIV_06985 [Dictyocaulus viviparus]